MKFYIRILLCTYIISTAILSAQPKKFFFKHNYPFIEVEGKFWLGTPFGLYQYSQDDDTWIKYDEDKGLPSSNITILEYQNDLLWVGTDKGIAYINIRLNTIFKYDTSDGLPDNRILCIAFEKDFTWVGTPKGAARFDNLIEKWESFTSKTGLDGDIVTGIFIDAGLVWLITNNSINEYDPSFEKWRYFRNEDGLDNCNIRYSISSKDYLWLFCENRIAKFNKKMRTIQFYQKERFLDFNNLNDFSILEDKIWIATKSGILFYDTGSDSFREFQEQNNLPEMDIPNFSFLENGKEIWFSASDGIYQFKTEQKSWIKHTTAAGLSRNNYSHIALSQGNIFAIFSDTVDYFRPGKGIWQTYFLSKDEKKKEAAFSFDREKGSFINFGNEYKLDISGFKSSFLFEKKINDYFNINKEEQINRNYSRNDLKAKLDLPEKRVINAFYNDNDFNEIVYGIKYRGNKEDWLQELSWGDIHTEQGKKILIFPISIFGYGTRMEFGTKTEKYKRSVLNIIAYAGQKTVSSDYDFFKGAVTKRIYTIRDIDYIKNQYYQIDSICPDYRDITDEEIYVDNLNKTDNSPNTLMNFIIAGILGNFDILIPVKDYYIDKKKGIILFNYSIPDSSIVILKYKSDNITREQVLQNKYLNNKNVNYYFIGGKSILPYSLNIKIIDKDNILHSLSEFGLDKNYDGIIDYEYIDYEQGILKFPSPKPFSQQVYEPVNPVSQYSIQIEFESEISTFNLKHRNLVRGSEVLIIDGQRKISGQDYIIDYTSGTLLFIKEGVLNDDNEIEIFYEYYKTVDENYYQVGIATGPSDNFWGEANYISFDKTDEITKTKKNVKIISGFSEIKWKYSEIDFQILPEFSKNISEKNSAYNLCIRSNVSSKFIRIFANFRNKDSLFEEVYKKRFKYGKLKNEFETGFQLDPLDYIRIFSRWRSRSGFENIYDKEASEKFLEGSILFNKNNLPALSLSAQQIKSEINDSIINRTVFRADLDYILSEETLRQLSIRSFTLNSFFRRSDEYINYFSKRLIRNIYENSYTRIGLSPVDLISLNTYYKHNSLDFQQTKIFPAKADDKIFFEAVNDKLKGMTFGMRYIGQLWWYYSNSESNSNNLRTSENFQFNSRMYPGQWLSFFQPFTFELNYQSNFSGYYSNIPNTSNWLLSFFDLPKNEIANQNSIEKFYQGRIEWRPNAEIIYYLSYDLSDLKTSFWNSTFQNNLRNFNNRIDYRPSISTFFMLQFNFQNEERENYYKRNRYSPSFWIESRLSEDFLIRLNISSYFEKVRQMNISQNNFSLVPLLSLIYKTSSLPVLGKVEFKDDISCSYFDADGYLSTFQTCSYSNSLYLDFFPLPFAIFRFRISNTLTKDYLVKNNDLWNHTFQARIIIQF